MSERSLSDADIQAVFEPLKASNAHFAERYPGEIVGRQPVQTLYGGAQLFKADTAQKMGVLSLRALETYAPNFAVLARAIDLKGSELLPTSWNEAEALAADIQENPDRAKNQNPAAYHAYTIYERVKAKLKAEAVEDFRIDFEDGYGNRPDDEEDADACRTAEEVVRGMKDGILPPFIGIRIKPWTDQLFQRSVRTLDVFITHLIKQTGGEFPNNFIVTLPKVTSPEQVSGLVSLLEKIEATHNLKTGTIPIEIMVETTQSMFNHEGAAILPLMVSAAKGRCRGAHFGTYDYTASCGIIARHQTMDHPNCDFSRHMMQVTLAGTGIMLSDGATNIMPVPVHRGDDLNLVQQAENLQAVHAAWALHVDHTRHSLKHAYYQGWDLHPAQLVTRYATIFDFFLRELDEATLRLKNFVKQAAQATLSGDVFDDAATGRGLLNYFRLAYNCSAITEKEIEAAGISLAELEGRAGSDTSPWLQILNNQG